MLVAFSFGDLAYLALAIFLIAAGIGLGWAFFRLAVTFDRLSSLIRGAELEVLPVINKVGGSVDRVNAQLDKLDHGDGQRRRRGRRGRRGGAQRQLAVKTPVQKLAGLSAGVSHGGPRCARAATGATPSRRRRKPLRAARQDLERGVEGAR